MPDLTFGMAYYNHAEVLEEYAAEWATWPKEILDRIEFLVVDDCSPVPIKPYPGISTYRITTDIPWNNAGADNLIFHTAKAPWVFRFDADIRINQYLAEDFLNMDKSPRRRYTPYRMWHNRLIKPHYNSFLMSKERFWEIGGYNEEFSGGWGYADAFFFWVSANTYDVKLKELTTMVEFNDKAQISGELRPPEIRERNHAIYNRLIEAHQLINGPVLNFDWTEIK